MIVDGGGHGRTGVDLHDLNVGVTDDGADLGPDRGGVTGHQDGLHAPQAIGRGPG